MSPAAPGRSKKMISLRGFPFRKTTAVVALLAFAMLLPAGAATASAAETQVSPLVIEHDPLACVTTSTAPLVEATIIPDRDLSKSYVYFRAAGNQDYYYVLMGGTPPSVEGVLPRPLPETKNIEYYVRATDTGQLSKSTPEYMPPVVDDNVCHTRGKAVPASGAGLTVGLTREGQPPKPPGFNAKDIAFVILASGAIVTLAAAIHAAAAGAGAAGSASGATAGGAASTGVSTGVLVGGGVIVAAGAAAVVANNSGKSSSNAPPVITISATPTSGTAPLPVTFTANVTDKENDTPYTVNWSFGDGTTGNGMTALHTYDGVGTFTASATATDSKNKTGSSNSLAISIPGPSAVIASVSWAGHAQLAIQILDGSGNSVGQASGPSDPCANQETTRTEQVILQGPALTSGSYTLTVSGSTCPSSPFFSPITAVGSVVTSTGASKCGPTAVPVTIPTSGFGTPMTVCTFSVP